MAIRSRNKVDVNFNMSSMTDMVFLLLIFFIILSTLVSQNALNLLLPKSSQQKVTNKAVSVSISDDLTYYVNKDVVSFEMLEQKILEETNKAGEKSLMLYMDKSLPVDEMVKVLNLAQRNGIKCALATEPE
jgi:biopolymer transport protein ExbD